MLSVLEGFYFATAPTMSILRAQRRFGTYFGWQVAHLAIAAAGIAMIAGDRGALGVALVSLACWGISLPTAVWLCAHPSQRSVGEAIGVFAAPWSAALPIGLAVWLIANVLTGQGSWGSATALLVVGPAALFASLFLTRWTQPAAWSDLQPMIGGALRLVRSGRRP